MATRLTRRIGGRPAEGGVGFRLHELGDGDGPTVVVLGGVHGDESQGVRRRRRWQPRRSAAISQGAWSWCRSPTRRRSWSARGSARSTAATSRARSPAPTPARPPSGSPSLLEREVLSAADLVVDLHSSGVHHTIAELAGFPDDGSPAAARAARGAAAMAMPVTWRHPDGMPPGRTGSAAFARGVPFLYLESPESADLSERLPGRRPAAALRGGPPPCRRRAATGTPAQVGGPGDLDDGSVRAPGAGLVEMLVDPGRSSRASRWRAGPPLVRLDDRPDRDRGRRGGRGASQPGRGPRRHGGPPGPGRRRLTAGTLPDDHGVSTRAGTAGPGSSAADPEARPSRCP